MKISSALSVFLAIGSLSHAATFYPITGITSDTSATDLWGASNLIAGAGTGFDASEPHNVLGTTGSGTAWVTNAPNGGTGDYFGPTPNPAPRLVVDLGSTVPLNEISVWGYSDTNGNGAISLDLRFSNTTTFSGAATSIAGITQPVTPRQSFSFADVTARYVEITPTDNLFGIAPPGGDRVGLSEIAFSVPIPEPSVGVFGLLGLGLAIRRRR